MGEKQENKLDMFGVGRVNYFAVSETREKFFQFRWDLKRFDKVLRHPDKVYESPIFEQQEEDKIFRWKLRVGPQYKSKEPNDIEESLYVTVYLVFVDGQHPGSVTFSVGLLDSNENKWYKVTKERVFATPNEMHGWSFFKASSISPLLHSKSDLLPDDTLKLYCRIWMEFETEHQVMKGCTIADRVKKQGQRDHAFFCDIQNLLMSSKFTDVEVQIKDTTIKAHKAILACRSSVFMAMFQNEMFESINEIVKISDFEEVIVLGMLHYIYSNAINRVLLEERAIEFLQIAEKYDIKGLKEEAEETIIINISVENAADCLVKADTHNALNLKAKVIEFININKEKVVKTRGFKKLKTYNKTLIVDLYMPKKADE